MKRRGIVLMIALAVALAACDDDAPVAPNVDVSTAKTGPNATPFTTSEPLQARLAAGVSGELKALATVGDIMPGSGITLAPIPDGIGVWGGNRFLNLMMNHELDDDGVEGQFAYARVSKLTIDLRTLAIVDHDYVIDGSEGYQRLCSAEWVDHRDGFPGGYFFTGEETDDGMQLIVDREGRVREAPWIGKYAHENQISVPGFSGHVVVLNFDDNGGSGVGREGATSELYMYVARNSNDVMRGRGQLYVYTADDEELLPSDLTPNVGIPGHWVQVPDDIARDFAALEQFADDQEVFPFIRLEDGFYDKRPGAGPTAYFYDTGRESVTDPDDGQPIDPWGSIYRVDFEDPADSAGGAATLTLLTRSSGPDQLWASPDNGDMNAEGEIMLQEDPANDPWSRRPGIWKFQLLGDGTLANQNGQLVIELVDPFVPNDDSAVFGNESSGIVDVSEWLGDGSWIFDVQAHDTPVPSLGLSEENGQLIYMKLNG